MPEVRRVHMLPKVDSRLFGQLMLFDRHVGVFGISRGSAIFAMGRLPSLAARHVYAPIPGGDVRLAVRPGSTDLAVFHHIFIAREYGWNFSASPRVIIDAGGYTGLSAAFFASQYPDATIIAIEPSPDNFELLRLNTVHFPNVYPVNAAVWPESGTISLVDPGGGPWALRTMENAGDSTNLVAGSQAVRAVTIDEIIKEFCLDRVDLLKMDVEGSEKEIFDSAETWLPSVDVICVELHDRFKNGCSRSFFRAVSDFSIELRRNEDVLVARPDSPLVPITQR
jgi:FkbM family methyltransferase